MTCEVYVYLFRNDLFLSVVFGNDGGSYDRGQDKFYLVL
jgi:hypothetical protein